MKTLLFLALTLTSLSSYAFTSVTIKYDAKLVKRDISSPLMALTSEVKGNDYCDISVSSLENTDSMTVTSGTVFEVTTVTQNNCVRDWGRQCRMDLKAYNQEKGVSLYLSCKNRGAFASELTVSKVNKIAKNKISVK